MTSSVLRRGIAGAAIASLLAAAAAVPAPAGAQGKVRVDPANDVVLLEFDEASDDTTETPAPAVDEGDIRRLGIKHGTKRVRIRAFYTQLSGAVEIQVFVARVATKRGLKRDIGVIAGPGNWRGQLFTEKPTGSDVNCPGAAHRISWKNDIITLSFPRSCLGSPKRVRVGAKHLWTDDLAASNSFYADDAFKDGRMGEAFAFSPWVWSS